MKENKEKEKIINKGAYRCYFHIGNLGFKFPRYCKYYANPILSFITGIIMNVLERKRYKYYVKHEPMQQWNRIWKSNTKDIRFCPCYFTCGLFSIYKHLPYSCSWEELEKEAKPQNVEEYWKEKTHWITNDIKEFNFKRDTNGKIYCIDYGDFTICTTYNNSVVNIDYK